MTAPLEPDQQELFDAIQQRAHALTWDEMQAALAGWALSGDAEAAHSHADDLLCSALLKARPDLRDFIRAYLCVPKWYA